eukprot:1375273-Lingulodinium_polyedra.AAC.1
MKSVSVLRCPTHCIGTFLMRRRYARLACLFCRGALLQPSLLHQLWLLQLSLALAIVCCGELGVVSCGEPWRAEGL